MMQAGASFQGSTVREKVSEMQNIGDKKGMFKGMFNMFKGFFQGHVQHDGGLACLRPFNGPGLCWNVYRLYERRRWR